MARRRKGNPIHGWLVLDKQQGMTSTQAVGQVKRLYGAQKAGHAGTLDPLATGVLPIALGEATKTVPFAVGGEKAYRFTVRWGVETTTDDADGDIAKESELRPSRREIEAILPAFMGEIVQIPPRFSAVKVGGERAYDLARGGDEVTLAPRPAVIDDLRLIDVPNTDAAAFEIRCGKGTYVRALARDMGRALGCLGHVVALKRTRVGPFDERGAVTLDSLRAAESGGGPEALAVLLKPIEAVLEDVTALEVSQTDAASLCRGQSVLLRGRDAPVFSGPVYAMSKGRLIALGEVDKGALRPTRVFNFAE